MNCPLVIFGEDWGAHPSSTQHLTQRLMKDRQVVWVNSIGLRRPRPTAGDLQRLLHKVMAGFSLRSTQKGLDQNHGRPASMISPLVVPVPKNGLERWANRRILGGQLARVLRHANIEKPIVWTSLPTAVDFLGCASERSVVYYCGDDFSSLTGVDHDRVQAAEQHLVARADLILAASETLVAKFPRNKTVYLPHGVDLDLFSKPMSPPDGFLGDRPTAGFYGSLSEWLDVELLRSVAQRLSQWRFIFVGAVRTDISRLRSLPNTEFHPPCVHQLLPAYVQNWTVSMLPFRDSAQIRACNPLKLREYLAAGTPIVSTDFPALDGYRDLVRVAQSPGDFADAILAAAQDGKHRNDARQVRVADESWDCRAKIVSNLLDAL